MQPVQIPVSRFHQTYYLPLIFKGEGEGKKIDAMQGKIKVGEPLADERPDAEKFSEWSYFHDFLRDTIFESTAKGKQQYKRLVLEAPDALDFVFREKPYTSKDEEKRFAAKVNKSVVHLFGNGVAVVQVELGYENARTLTDVLTLTECTRRLWPPYWVEGYVDEETQKPVPRVGGGVPMFSGLTGQTQGSANPEDMWAAVLDNKPTPLLQHWKLLLKGFDLNDWRMPSDERLFVQSFMALEKNQASNAATLKQIDQATWWRIAECDGPNSSVAGDQEAFAYNQEHLVNQVPNPFYDRFLPAEGMPDYIATRQVIAASHHALVTVDNPGSDPNFADTLKVHFEHHYARMALLIRHEHASLLAYSRRMSNLVRDAADNNLGDSDLTKEIVRLRRDFLNFTHMYRFTGVSDQIQPTEMYNMWRKNSWLVELYADVSAELQVATDFANAQSAQQEAQRASTLADAAAVLAVVLIPFTILATPWIDGYIDSLAVCGDGLVGCHVVATLLALVVSVAGYQALRTKKFWFRK